MVGDVLQNPLIYKDTFVANRYGATDSARWYDVAVGSNVSQILLDMAWRNSKGYNVNDPGTGPSFTGQGAQSFFKVHVKTCTAHIHLTNISNAPIHLSAYEVTPRGWLRHDARTPAEQLNFYSEQGDLPDDVDSNNLMKPTDPRFTPFMSKMTTVFWKIGGVKFFKIPAGGEVKCYMRMNDFKLSGWFDAITSPHYQKFRPGKVKFLLFKQVGVEGTDSATHLDLRLTENFLRIRTDYEYHFNAVSDRRPIVHNPSYALPPDSNSTFENPIKAEASAFATI